MVSERRRSGYSDSVMVKIAGSNLGLGQFETSKLSPRPSSEWVV